MSPMDELSPMNPDEELRQRIKIHNAIQWTWRLLVIMIVIFQIVGLVMLNNFITNVTSILKSQSEAMKYVVAVTVDEKTIDPDTKLPTPWVVEIYRKLEMALKADQQSRDQFTHLAQDRVLKNSEIAEQMQKQFDGFISEYHLENENAKKERQSILNDMRTLFTDIGNQLDDVVDQSKETLSEARAARQDAKVTRYHSATVQRKVLQALPAKKKNIFGF